MKNLNEIICDLTFLAIFYYIYVIFQLLSIVIRERYGTIGFRTAKR